MVDISWISTIVFNIWSTFLKKHFVLLTHSGASLFSDKANLSLFTVVFGCYSFKLWNFERMLKPIYKLRHFIGELLYFMLFLSPLGLWCWLELWWGIVKFSVFEQRSKNLAENYNRFPSFCPYAVKHAHCTDTAKKGKHGFKMDDTIYPVFDFLFEIS